MYTNGTSLHWQLGSGGSRRPRSKGGSEIDPRGALSIHSHADP